MSASFFWRFDGVDQQSRVCAGPAFYWLFAFFPVSNIVEQAGSGYGLDATGVVRLAQPGRPLCRGVFVHAGAYGLKGVFDVTKPWRAALILLTFVGCLYTGFRRT